LRRRREGCFRFFEVLLHLRCRLGFEVRHVLPVETAQPDRYVLVDRAGMRLLFRDAQFGEPVEDFVSFHFQLACQLIDPNLFHR
jgi:hypothetical protein